MEYVNVLEEVYVKLFITGVFRETGETLGETLEETFPNLRNFHYPCRGSKPPYFSLFQALWPPGPF